MECAYTVKDAECKWLSEIVHSNPAWLNKATADKLGIPRRPDKDHKPCRLSIVTKAKGYRGHTSKRLLLYPIRFGTKFGRVAAAKRMNRPQCGAM